MRKKHLQFVLSHHEHKIWQSADGRWKTYITDEESGKRKQISRESREELETFLYDKYLAEDEELAKKRATMESLYDDWAEYKSLFVSEATIKRDRNTWKALYKDAPIVKKPLVSITKTELERWLLSVIRSKNMNSHQLPFLTIRHNLHFYISIYLYFLFRILALNQMAKTKMNPPSINDHIGFHFNTTEITAAANSRSEAIMHTFSFFRKTDCFLRYITNE
jgi:hypothetical protein